MADDSNRPATFVLATPMIVMGLGCVVMSGLVSGLTTGMGNPAHAKMSILAAITCGGAGLLGLALVWFLVTRQGRGFAVALPAACALCVVAGAAVAASAKWWWGWQDTGLFAMWIAGWCAAVVALLCVLVLSQRGGGAGEAAA